MSSKYTGNGPSDDRFEDRFDDRDYTQYTDYPGDDYAEYEDVVDEQPEYVEHDDYGDYADYVDSAEPVEEYAGAHRRRDDAEYDDTEYEDGAYLAERESAGSTAAAAGGVPKRGLAMILIAVAALLLLWGIFALTQKDGADTGNSAATTSATTAANATDATDAPDAAVTATATATEFATATDTVMPPAPSTVPGASDVNDPANPNPADPAAPAAPAPALDGGPAVTAENAQVFVYNNSQVSNAAANTAATLNADYPVANLDERQPQLMNMPEQEYGTFGQTSVLYDPRANGAREVAETIARQVGGVVVPTNNLPADVRDLPAAVKGNRQAITVVIAGQ